MAQSRSLDVVIINRNYPPRAGVTGESACRLAKYLRSEHNINVSIVTVRSTYQGAGTAIEPTEKVYEIASLYDGKKKLLRLLSSFVESFRLIWKARRLGATKTIVMTDPPFLTFWASLLLGKKRNWILWSMDLFPDAFVAGKLISEQSIFYQMLDWIVYRAAPESLIALGPLQAEYLRDKYALAIDTAILPCGVFQRVVAEETPDWKANHPEKIILGYCGNLGEAHSVRFLEAVIDHLDPAKFHLVLSLYGVRAAEIMKTLPAKPDAISVVSSVERQELAYIDVHLVSLLNHWTHVCVPSKAVSAVCSGSAFLFFGTSQCDNWELLGKAGWIIEENQNTDLRQEVAKFMLTLEPDALEVKQIIAKETAADLKELFWHGCSTVAQLLTIKKT